VTADLKSSELDRAVAAAADRLEAAAARRRQCPPVRDLLPDSLSPDAALRAAYAVQQLLTSRRLAAGAVVVGRKIGLTSAAVQRQLGVEEPDFGVLFADMDASDWARIPSSLLLQPKAEAEIAFVLSADLDQGDLDDVQIRAAVGYAVAALEIVDSRVDDWDITITDTVADNGSSALFVLSGERLSLTDFEPREVTMQLFMDGELVSEGTGAASLGDPLRALGWLARTARDLGDPLRADQVILSGSLGPVVAAPPGAVFRAELSSLGSVTTMFSASTVDPPLPDDSPL
jgi:2-keto-4-pentenoate hydratase